MVGRQGHMVVSVLIVSDVGGNAPQAPHIFLQGRGHLHFSKPWWLLKSLWSSQRLWTYSRCPNEMMVCQCDGCDVPNIDSWAGKQHLTSYVARHYLLLLCPVVLTDWKTQ